MANYVASARSNYFPVVDLDKFKKWAAEWGLIVVEDSDDGMVMIHPDENVIDSGGWPSGVFSEELGDWDYDRSLAGELSKHIVPGHAAILAEVGAERLRYLMGIADVITSEGLVKTFDINQSARAFCKLKKLKATKCEY